jgi:homopolymeric O-antigen transport system permease protein
MNNHHKQYWDKIIRPRNGWFDIHPGELWKYRDLIGLFVWRDFVSIYKQTILGPLWYILQPLLTTIVFTVIFGNVAKLPTDGLPPFLFYLSGVIAWRYFADCLTNTANTFVGNAHIFGKVYFPRLTVPVSVVISNLIAFGIQFLLFLAFYFYYWGWSTVIRPQPALLLLPVLIIQMAALGLGFGIIVSSMTTRYRDLTHLVGFGVQLWMFATPVVYPASSLPDKWRWVLLLNPMAPIIESFRFAFLGTGSIDSRTLLISMASTVCILLVGVVLFSRVEKSFMDTV